MFQDTVLSFHTEGFPDIDTPADCSEESERERERERENERERTRERE